jgi:ATP-dependent Clp protease protease subunit
MKKDLTDIYVQHNSKGKTYAEFEVGMDRDNFLSAQEAIDWGLADEIVNNRVS